MARRVLVRGIVVAGRGHRRDVQHALGYGGVQLQRAGQLRARALARPQQLGRRRGDQQPGRRAVARVQLLAGRRLEDHVEAQRAGRHLRRRPLGAVRHRVHPDRLLGQPQPGQPVPGRLHDHDVLANDHRVAGLAQIRGERGDLAGRRVVAAQRVVVGVADRHRAVRQRRHPQRMLEQGLVRRPVPVAEVEQTGADRRVDRALGIDPAQRGGLGVGEPQPLLRRREAGGLGEPRLGTGPVHQPLVGRARRDPDRARLWVVRPQLVHTRHRDPHPAAEHGHVPRRGQVHLARRARGGRALPPLPAGARERRHLAGGHVQAAQRVVDGVGDDHRAVRQQRQALRLAERRRVGRAVREAAHAGADAPHHALAVRRQLHQLVPGGVADQEIPGRQQQRLAGEAERGGLRLRRHVRTVAPAQGALGRVLGLQLLHQLRYRVRVPLAGVLGDDVPLGVDHHQRGPGPHRVLLPRGQLGVVEHRVLHPVPLHGVHHRLVLRLVHELRRVHPDDHHRVPVLLLQLPQLVQDVQAVDAAEGPEIQNDDASPQVGEGVLGVARVQPAALADQLGGPDPDAPGCALTHASRVARPRGKPRSLWITPDDPGRTRPVRPLAAFRGGAPGKP